MPGTSLLGPRPRTEPLEAGICGSLVIKRGLKRRARKRTLEIDAEMKEVIEALLAVSECDHVFTHPGNPGQPLGAWVLETQMAELRTEIKTHPDAGLHGLRHTFLTEVGEYTDPFTLQYAAGHDNIERVMRYVHPQANAVRTFFARLAALRNGKVSERSTAQKVVTKLDTVGSTPKRCIRKVAESKELLSAEVVKLADTPS